MSEKNRVWRLRKRPSGDLTDDVLSFAEEAIPEPGEGECLFRLNYLSLDPTNRIWMSDADQYMPPVDLDAQMRGLVCGTVVKSNIDALKPGDIISGLGVWADYQIGTEETVGLLGGIDKVSVADAFATFALVGPTAYIGLLDVGQPKPGETVVVSAAAGAVGSIVGQIAKIKGCRAVGLAGSDEKCRWLTEELGYDAAINYKTQSVPEALKAACPDGIDVYFDNVGGEILSACFKQMNLYGRIPTCGLISQYNAQGEVFGPKYYEMILMQRLRVQGFIAFDDPELVAKAIEEVSQWMAEGKIKTRVDLVDGLENSLEALKTLFTGENSGKLMVQVQTP